MAGSWYVLRIQARTENLSAGELKRDGYKIFFPCFKKLYSGLGSDKVPLFPGYIFIYCDPETNGWPIFRPVHRVSGWVKFEGMVPSVPDYVIDGLVAQLDSGQGGDGFGKRFEPGQFVRVSTGFLSAVGKVVEGAKSPTERSKILLEFMGRQIPAYVPWDQIESIPESLPLIRPVTGRRTRGGRRWTKRFRDSVVNKS